MNCHLDETKQVDDDPDKLDGDKYHLITKLIGPYRMVSTAIAQGPLLPVNEKATKGDWFCALLQVLAFSARSLFEFCSFVGGVDF